MNATPSNCHPCVSDDISTECVLCVSILLSQAVGRTVLAKGRKSGYAHVSIQLLAAVINERKTTLESRRAHVSEQLPAVVINKSKT